MDVFGIVNEYFQKPIENFEGYNLINTTFYSFLAILLFFIFYPFVYNTFKNKKAMYVVFFLFVVFGSLIRVLEEPYSGINLVKRSSNPLELGFYFVTPGIYIGVFSFFLLFLFIMKNNFKLAVFLLFLSIFVPFFLILIKKPLFLPFFIVSLLPVWGIKKADYKLLPFFGETLDGFFTFLGFVLFSFKEQHVVSNLLLSVSPFFFLVVKIFLGFIIYFFANWLEKEDYYYSHLLSSFVFILSFATGIRDFYSIVLGIV